MTASYQVGLTLSCSLLVICMSALDLRGYLPAFSVNVLFTFIISTSHVGWYFAALWIACCSIKFSMYSFMCYFLISNLYELISFCSVVIVIIYFDSQTVPDLTSGSPLRLSAEPFMLWVIPHFWHKMFQAHLCFELSCIISQPWNYSFLQGAGVCLNGEWY